ncbi:hypothetical protein ACLOJK_030503 [Asimina triloba]
MAITVSNPPPPSKLRIEAVQTVTPGKVSDPGLSRPISISGPGRAELYQKHHHMVFYYRKVHEEECGWNIAAWFKESLNTALTVQPVFAGRIGHGPDGEVAIVFNDCGARMVQAQMETTMSEFLNSSGREDAEAQLATWRDINAENPQNSALFYVQVTNFQGDDYSIGITASVVLADPLLVATFIKRWAFIHNSMLAQTNAPKSPLFALPNCIKTHGTARRNIYAPIIVTTPCNQTGYKTTAFKLPKVDSRTLVDDDDAREAIARACLESDHDDKTFSKLSLVFHNRSGDLKAITTVGTEEGRSGRRFDGEMGPLSWDDMGLKDVSFFKSNMPVHVSNSVESCPDEGLVLIMPPVEGGGLGVSVCVTVPKI